MTDRSARSHVYVGAAQSKPGTLAGVFRRAAGEDRWERLTKGLPEATSVQAITVHPTNPDVVYLGTRAGAYRSLDRGERWERLAFPDDGAEVWSILVHPRDPRILYAGTSPVSVYRSDDGGDTWRRLPKVAPVERVKMKSFVCRVMRLTADPERPDELYAALEVGGALRSPDGGETWTRFDHDVKAESTMMAVALHPRDPDQVYCTSRTGQVFGTADGGRTWREHRLPDAVQDVYAIACG